jgi:hypothetical protein
VARLLQQERLRRARELSLMLTAVLTNWASPSTPSPCST